MATFDHDHVPDDGPIGYCATIASAANGKVISRSGITTEHRARTIARRWTQEIPSGVVYLETIYAKPTDDGKGG